MPTTIALPRPTPGSSSVEREPRMIEAIVANFDEMIAEPRPGPEVGWNEDDNWSWCDALFMAPPTMALVAEATDDLRYLDLMNSMWWQTYDYLYDPAEHLWYRDGRYVIQEDGSGPRTTQRPKGVLVARQWLGVRRPRARSRTHAGRLSRSPALRGTLPRDGRGPRGRPGRRRAVAVEPARCGGVPDPGVERQRILHLRAGVGRQQRRAGR